MTFPFFGGSPRARRLLPLIVFVLTVPALVCAQDLEGDRFTVRGFGTLGVVTHDTDGIEYRRNTGEAHGARAGQVYAGTDSGAGAQLDFRLSPQFDVSLQGVSRQRADGDWTPKITQAFLRWSPDESIVLRAGRIGFDIYLLAESRQVGYSYLTIRPSPEFYGQITNDDIDGGDISYTRRVRHGLVCARLFGGKGSGELAFPDGTHSSTKADVYGGTLDWLWRGFTARAAYVEFDYDAGDDLALLVAGLRATGVPGAVSIADDLDRPRFSAHGLQVGGSYDDGPLLAQIMYAMVSSDSIGGPDFDEYFALGGYRIGKWTPFAQWASSRDRDSVRSTGLPDIPQLDPLNRAVSLIQWATRSTQRSTSAGVRYNFSSHLDFKFQVDRVHVTDSSLILDRRPQGGPADLTVFGAAVDFAF